MKQAMPNARLYLILQPALEPLFYDHPLLEGTITWDQDGGEEVLAGSLRAISADTIVHFNEHSGVERAALAAGIPQRIGWSRGQHECLTEVVPDTRKGGGQHEVRFCWELLSRIGLPPLPGNPEPRLSPDSRARAELSRLRLSRPYVVVHLAAHGKKPRVPAPYFAAALQPWKELGEIEVVVVGGEPEPDVVKDFAKELSASFRVLDVTGSLPLAPLAWLLSDAAFCVSRDSGPAHLAAAMGCPTLTLFPEPSAWMSPVRWRPLGPHVWTYHKPTKRRFWDTQRSFVRRSLHAFEACEIAALGAEALRLARQRLQEEGD